MNHQNTNNTTPNPPDFQYFINWFWKLFGIGVGLVILVFVLASLGVLGEMPDHTRLENPETNIATEIISADGKTLGKYYLNDNRTPVGYSELPKHLVDALIATEDARFYNHSGIDARGTLRAVIFLGKKGGASTISQQLAKQLFNKREGANFFEKISQKIREWIIAIRLERQYTKEEIITQYFNIYDFGNYADGIRSASRIYFRKEPRDLNLKESAMLVGMFKNSSLYNPQRNPVGTKNRRNVVLEQMYKYDYIDEATKDALKKTELDTRFTPESHKTGMATYFREYLRGFMKEWINEEKNLKPNGEKYDLYSDGLKIFTTIDSRMQAYAEDAAVKHMANLQREFDKQNAKYKNNNAPFINLSKQEVDKILTNAMRRSKRWYDMKNQSYSEKEIIASFKKPTQMTVFKWVNGQATEVDTLMRPIDSIRYYKSFLHTALMAMDPTTGHIKAWVGGTNYKHFQYDMVKLGKRQVGSTFKPFVYATAIDQLQLSPCDSIPRSQITIETGKYFNAQPWTPSNPDGNYSGKQTLKSALANSTNTVTARLINRVGPKAVVDMVKRLGINEKIVPVPAIALGSPELSVYEMVSAYSTFANGGVYNNPVVVTRIEDKNGNVLYQYVPKSKDVLSEEVAYVTVNLMEGVTQGGSGTRLRHSWAVNNSMYKSVITGYPYALDNPIAGKTGTTQNQSDGWFMGMVPNLATGVWVGAEDRSVHFRSLNYGQGATMALPIWGLFMKNCYKDKSLNVSKEPFKRPENLSIRINCSSPAPTTTTTEETPATDEGGLDF